MKQIVRFKTFETNSSSIHCLTYSLINLKELNDELFDLKCDILPYTDKEIEYTMEFKTIEEKLRYLWTLRCKGNLFGVDDESIDNFTSMLRSIFSNVNFIDIDDPGYFEDFEWGFDEDLLYNEDFIKNVIQNGNIIFTTRDYYNDWKLESLIDNIRSYKNDSERKTLKWEG